MDHRAIIGTVLFVLCLCAQTPSNQAQISSLLDSFKAQYLPKEYRDINLTLDDLKKVIHAKCGKANANYSTEFYEELEKTATQSIDCLSKSVNVTAMQEEIEIARPKGELDSVFHNYCSKVPVIENCIQNFTAKVQHCLSENERVQSTVLMRIVKNLIGFLCSKGGDQIALFVAEQGPECLEVNKEPLGHCLNSTFGEFLQPNDNKTNTNANQTFDMSHLDEFVFSPKHCVDLERFEACAIHHLEQCEEITPANVAESVFRFIKNEANCTNWIASLTTEKSILKSGVRSSSNGMPNISISLILLSSAFVAFISHKISYEKIQ